jgi:hypothetical protein
MSVWAVAVVSLLVACGAPRGELDSSAPTREALERVQDLARTGDGQDWAEASAEVKRAFTLAAVVGMGFPDADRDRHAATLTACLNRAAAATPDQPLAQLAADCANSDLRAAAQEVVASNTEVQIDEAQFEACRPEVARLVYGRISDWRTALPECRVAYAMVSVDAASGGSATPDPVRVRAFLSCISRLTEDAPGHEQLTEASYQCSQSL